LYNTDATKYMQQQAAGTLYVSISNQCDLAKLFPQHSITGVQKPLIFHLPVAGTPGDRRWDPKRQPSFQ